jgi:LPXTG-site transpeptidase (sortase) family protein
MNNSFIKIFFKSALLVIPGIILFVFLATNYPTDKKISSIFKLKNHKSVNTAETSASVKLAEESPFLDYLEPVEATPVRIKAPNVGIDAEIIEVGVDADGTLEAPADWSKAGWYTKSAKPGLKGNVIIDGHYDSNTGAPAAFWNLKNLMVGDKVVVVDEYGVEHTYVVDELIHVSINDTDRLEKLNMHTGRTLTLITCGGFWNPVVGTYDERLIIKATIEERLKDKNSS